MDVLQISSQLSNLSHFAALALELPVSWTQKLYAYVFKKHCDVICTMEKYLALEKIKASPTVQFRSLQHQARRGQETISTGAVMHQTL